jgi:acyl-CoA synthetase (AMP-forming)/AMP-acid ligase II
MVNALLQQPDLERRDLASLRLIIDGGEKMPLPLIQRLGAAFPGARFADAYGLTETVSGDTFLDRTHTLSKLGSVGKPVVHLELKVVDDEGREVGPNEPGEIVLRGPKVFAGYWRNPEATAAAIRDGWFHTGDVGRLDEDGYLFILDRKKDLIISGGENIASPEVERVLYEHPAVLECAVVGRPDDRWGEVPVAFVVLKPGRSVEAAELLAHCAGQLARFKVPKDVRFLGELPRNPSGKVLKRVLRDRA